MHRIGMGKISAAAVIAALSLTGAASTHASAAAVTSTPAPSAASMTSAATCSGVNCDYKDPVQTGCSTGSTVVDRKSTGKGTFELRWSSTCQTNWVQIPNYAGGGQYLKFNVCDYYPASGASICSPFTAQPTPGLHYGNMVYSRANHCAKGSARWGSGSQNEVYLASSKC